MGIWANFLEIYVFGKYSDIMSDHDADVYKRQPLDVDGLSMLMPPKTAPENIIESVQVPTNLPVQRCV